MIVNASAGPELYALRDLVSGVTNFNGNDAIALQLVSSGSNVDVIGEIGFDPGSYWGTADDNTVNHTLVRKNTVCIGDSNGAR